jgi:hypothetical protein
MQYRQNNFKDMQIFWEYPWFTSLNI